MKKLADMGGVTEDISVISSKVRLQCFFVAQIIKDLVGWQVNQQKAKLIDLEANVTLQERSNGKVISYYSKHVSANAIFKNDKYFQLSEDLKKMSETLTESKANVDQKLEKLEVTKKELVLTVSDMGKANTTLGQELASLTGLKTKAPAWDRKAETTEVDNRSPPHSQ